MSTTAIVLVIMAVISLIAALIGIIKDFRFHPNSKKQDPASLLDEQVADLFRKTYNPGILRGVLPENSDPPEDGSFYIHNQRGHFYYRGILFRFCSGSVGILVAPTPETPVPSKDDGYHWTICHSTARHIPGPWDETIREALGVWELKVKDIQERLKQKELAQQEFRKEQDRKEAEKLEALRVAWERPKGIHGAG